MPITTGHNLYVGSINKTDKIKVKGHYSLIIPPNPEEKSPLVILLQASGDRGNPEWIEDEIIVDHYLANKIPNNFYLLAPTCEHDDIYNPYVVMSMVREVCSNHNINQSAISIVGHSMGARGAWDLAFTFPDKFKSLLPVAGVGCYLRSARIAHIPSLIIHGGQDNVVDLAESKVMFHSLKQCKNFSEHTRLLIEPNENHFTIKRFMLIPQVWNWLLDPNIDHLLGD